MPVPIMSGTTTLSETAAMPHGPGINARRGRRTSSVNMRAKLERSRQSARECRERKKLRYQYLEELITNRERAIFLLRKELEMFKRWCISVDRGEVPADLLAYLNKQKKYMEQQNMETSAGSKNYEVGTSVECVRIDTKSSSVGQLQASDNDDGSTSYHPSDETAPQNFEGHDQKMESGTFETQSFTSVDYEDDSFLDAYTLGK